jgi:hypothetical protein
VLHAPPISSNTLLLCVQIQHKINPNLLLEPITSSIHVYFLNDFNVPTTNNSEIGSSTTLITSWSSSLYIKVCFKN